MASGHACVSSVRQQVERSACCSAAALCAIRTRRRRRSRRAHRALLKTWQRIKEEGLSEKNDGRDGV